jgi:hypothetical protein
MGSETDTVSALERSLGALRTGLMGRHQLGGSRAFL